MLDDGKLLEYKVRAGFPIMPYLQQYYPDGRINSSGQYVGTCCQCNKKDKFYYDVKGFKGLCQSCYAKRDGAGFKTLIGLIMFTESLEYVQAIERLKSSSVTRDVGVSIMEEISKFKDRLSQKTDDIEWWNIPINVDIPICIPIDKDRVSEYFNSRSNPMRIDILEAFPAFFSGATFLNNRVIFKIETNESYAWLGYLMGKATDNNPKTLNPKGSVLSFMLGGYNYFKDSNEPLLIHEGIFDMFRSVLRGYHAVCLFGKVLSIKQIILLNETKSDEIVLCLDGDKAGLTAMWKFIKEHKKYLNKKMSMMKLPFGEDPDSCGASLFKRAFQDRREIY